MTKLKVKIKKENKTFSTETYLTDDFIISKKDPSFLAIIESAIIESTLEKPDSVIVLVTFDI